MSSQLQGDTIIELVNVNKWVREVSCAAQYQPKRETLGANCDLRAEWLGQIYDDPLHQPPRRTPSRAISSLMARL